MHTYDWSIVFGVMTVTMCVVCKIVGLHVHVHVPALAWAHWCVRGMSACVKLCENPCVYNSARFLFHV